MDKKIEKALSCLTPKQRDVMIMRYYYGDNKKPMTFSQIADKLQISKSCAYKLHQRALIRIQENQP